MEQNLIDVLVAWAGRNPGLVGILFGPILIAIGAVLATSRGSASHPEPPARFQSEPETAEEPIAATQAALAFPDPAHDSDHLEEASEAITARVVAVAPEPGPEPEPAASARLRDRLRLTSESLVGRLGSLLGGRSVDAEVLDDLEAMLFQADLGVKTANSLLAEVSSKAAGGDADAVRRVLHDAILAKLSRVQTDGGLEKAAKPHVILVLGVNGAGKTTSIGKLAARYRGAGNEVLLGAADTFRAAATEQLQAWGDRAGCDVIAGQSGGDPSAVAFDTVRAAKARGADVAIIDTAGRLQTRQPLMEELGKMVRVIGKGLDDAPHEVLLVLDATTGQNAISQAKLFTEVAGVTGLILTKLDGTAKGGVLVGLADEFGIPVKYVGVGESVEDLRNFDAAEFVDAVFGDG